MMESKFSTKYVLTFLFSALSYFSITLASPGDRSIYYNRCLASCQKETCDSSSNRLQLFHAQQAWHDRLLWWSCPEECSYQCMWDTVENSYKKNGFPVQQFHGKWPFVRILGIQEPASAIFSILNLLPHIYMFREMRKTVSSETKTYPVWLGYSLVSINTWTWSTIFHTRDWDFTEKMDYLCAFSVVMYSLLAFLLRSIGGGLSRDGSLCGSFTTTWISIISCIGCFAFFLRHVHRMVLIHFDYGYNMQVNIGVGLVNSILWFLWCFKNRRKLPHVKTAALAVLLLNVTVLLELLDFEPIFGIFDSHSLWHLATAPIHLVWYSFVIKDCDYLYNESKKDIGKLV